MRTVLARSLTHPRDDLVPVMVPGVYVRALPYQEQCRGRLVRIPEVFDGWLNLFVSEGNNPMFHSVTA